MAVVTGTAANDVLAGTSKDDTLDGLTGIDTMAGGNGNDIYFVDQAGDVVTELANRGLQDWTPRPWPFSPRRWRPRSRRSSFSTS